MRATAVNDVKNYGRRWKIDPRYFVTCMKFWPHASVLNYTCSLPYGSTWQTLKIFLNFLLSNRLFVTLSLQTLKYFSESGLPLYFYLSCFKIQRRVVQRPSLTTFVVFLHRTLYQNGAICQKHTACDSVFVGLGAPFLLIETADYVKRFQEIPVAVRTASIFLLILCSIQY